MTLAQATLLTPGRQNLIGVNLRANRKRRIRVSEQSRKPFFEKEFFLKKNREIELWCRRGSGINRHFKQLMLYNFLLSVFFLIIFNSSLYLEVIVDPRSGAKNNSERPHVTSPSFPKCYTLLPTVTTGRLTSADRIQSIFITMRIPDVVL